MTQEDFSDVSSRTYLSTLERGVKSPTLEKIDQICHQLQVHPLTLLAMTYRERDALTATEVMKLVQLET